MTLQKETASNTWLAITFNKSTCLHYCILSMKALLKSNRYTNYDFTPLKKLNRLRFIIFTPPSIFFGYKSDFEKKSIFRKKRMANLLSIVNQQQAPIDEEKLKLFCMRQNVWEYFGLERDVFLMLSEEKQL